MAVRSSHQGCAGAAARRSCSRGVSPPGTSGVVGDAGGQLLSWSDPETDPHAVKLFAAHLAPDSGLLTCIAPQAPSPHRVMPLPASRRR